MKKSKKRPERDRKLIVALARALHEEDGKVEIDDDAKLSAGTDNGTYVQAWVWVSFGGTIFDKEPE